MLFCHFLPQGTNQLSCIDTKIDRIFGIKLMENILFTLQKLYAGKLYSTMRTFVSIIS